LEASDSLVVAKRKRFSVKGGQRERKTQKFTKTDLPNVHTPSFFLVQAANQNGDFSLEGQPCQPHAPLPPESGLGPSNQDFGSGEAADHDLKLCASATQLLSPICDGSWR
jgi:hypothetical protein